MIDDVLQRLRYQITPARSTSLYFPNRPQNTWQEHVELFEAIKRRDPDSAELKMKIHIKNAGVAASYLMEQLSIKST